MDGHALFFTGLKIVVVLLFVVNTAAILTWGERRQSAMIQDRIGPNRAVIYLPGWLFKILSLAVGFGLAARPATTLSSLSRGPIPSASMRGSLSPSSPFGSGGSASSCCDGSRFVGKRRAGSVVSSRGSTMLGHLLCRPRGARRACGARILAGDGEAGALGTVFQFGSAAAVILLAAFGILGFTRVPPGKVGLRLGGTLHALADGAKMAFKEDFVPTNADRLLHSFGPIIALFPAFVVFAVVPFGDTLCIHVGNSGHFWADLFHARIGQITAAGIRRWCRVTAFAPRERCRSRWQASTWAFSTCSPLPAPASSAPPSQAGRPTTSSRCSEVFARRVKWSATKSRWVCRWSGRS